MTEFKKKDPLDFKQIVFQMIQHIGTKSLIEFRGSQEKTIIHGNWSETYIEPDARKEFVQGIKFLSDLLIGYIEDDKKTEEEYKRISELLSEKKELVNSDKLDSEDYIITKVNLMRELFRVMMRRLKATGYLKQEARFG